MILATGAPFGRCWTHVDEGAVPVEVAWRVKRVSAEPSGRASCFWFPGSLVPGMSDGGAKTFLTAEELVLREMAHRGVGVAEGVNLAEEDSELVGSVSRTPLSATRRNPAAPNALHVFSTEG